MKMTGDERIAAPRARVWGALNDPQVLRQCIPGCQALERESAEKLRAVVEIKIGPIGARFNSVIVISDVVPSESYTLVAEGQGGTVGSGKSTIRVRLADEGAHTRLLYDVEAQVGGRLAQLGGPLIDSTAKQLGGKFFKRFGEIVEGTASAPAVTTTADVAAAEIPTSTPARAVSSRASVSVPVAWTLALAVAALTGFLIGRGQSNAAGSDWAGLAIGLLVIIVAAAGFEFGRRGASTQVVLDAASLERLLRGDKQ